MQCTHKCVCVCVLNMHHHIMHMYEMYQGSSLPHQGHLLDSPRKNNETAAHLSCADLTAISPNIISESPLNVFKKTMLEGCKSRFIVGNQCLVLKYNR